MSFVGSEWVKTTMFVRTRSGSHPASGQRSRDCFGEPCALRWSSTRRSTIVSSATRPQQR